MLLGDQGDVKRSECVLSRVVQICEVLPCLSYKLLATPQGACSAQKRPAKDVPDENRFTTWSFKPPRTHMINVSAPFPMVNQKHVAGNTMVSSYIKIRNNNYKDFTPKMTFDRTLKIFWEFGMCSKSIGTN